MKSLLTVLLAATLPVPAPAAHTLDWHVCGKALDAQCATLKVPIDWSRPGGVTLDLEVARRPARDQDHKVGTLVFGPGGPWDPGVYRVADGSSRFSDTQLDRFDIVSFDPRGSNTSRPLVTCDRAAAGPAPGPVLTSQADFEETFDYNRRLWKTCAELTGDLWNHASMLDNVRDVEALRIALGVPTISFHGSSYGTLLGEQYAERYPGRVRAMVLESVDDHSVPTTSAFLTSQAAAFEDAFDDFADWCDATESCSLNPRGGARTVWHRLIATRDHFDLDAVLLVRLRDAAYADLANDLAAVDGGGPLRHVTDLGVVIPTFCSDWSLPVRDYDEYAAFLRRSAAVAPDTGYPAQVFALTMCLGWPNVANPQHVLDVRTRTPILLVNSRHDPATGLNWARAVERQLGRHGVLVTYQGAGHGAYGKSKCIQRKADDYLVSRRVPVVTTCPIA
ncbi:alpha/beta hydrolase [Actinoplanes sp. CA-142083]|uniref:alpha/beta hydrolase n=1 Tax=Actinoplanes sp. CA-142083 TaxID=3239903 RepID=UPI003D8D4034